MDSSLALGITAFVVHFISTLLAIGHYVGKFEGRITMAEDQNVETHKLALRTYKEFTEYKADHGSLKTQVAVNDVKFTESVNGMRSEMKELKETFKEFTIEMRGWVQNKK